jgi:hypothetical protein
VTLLSHNIPFICNSGFLDIVRRQYFNKTTFRKLDLLLHLRPGLRLAQPGGPTLKVSVLPFLTEDGRRSSFRNVDILLKYRRWTMSKKTTITDYNAPSSEPFRLHLYHSSSKLHVPNLFCPVFLNLVFHPH